jgi:hypothetical protein
MNRRTLGGSNAIMAKAITISTSETKGIFSFNLIPLGEKYLKLETINNPAPAVKARASSDSDNFGELIPDETATHRLKTTRPAAEGLANPVKSDESAVLLKRASLRAAHAI